MVAEGESNVAVARRPVVVCVDDEAPVLASLRRTLRKEPYEVLTTQDPGEALRWIGRSPVDLVITDQRMPGMTGMQLLHAVKERRPGLACLMLTAYPETPTVVERTRNGAMRLMTKPWSEEALRDTVRQLVEPSGGGARPSAPWIWCCPDVQELLVVLDCRGRDASELLERLEVAQERPECEWAGWVIVLEQLGALDDSAVELMKRLTERIRAWGIPTDLVDRSGGARALLDRIRASGPIALYTPELFPARRREVLLVEGDSKTRTYLRTLVGALGHACAVAPSVDGALAAPASARADLAFLDLALLDAPSIASLRRLRDRRPDLEIVAWSTFRDLWDEGTGAALGFCRHLRKPLRAFEVLSALGIASF